MANDPVIVLKSVSLILKDQIILDNITCNINENTITTIFGPNGGGKTTLINLIIGNAKPTSGTITVYNSSPQEIDGIIGYVPQDFTQLKEFPITVFKAILTGTYGKLGFSSRPGHAEHYAALETMKEVGLEEHGEKQLSEISFGMLQRVIIARAIVSQPKILILDEATSGVDAGSKETIFSLLINLKKRMTILFVTHDMSVITNEVDSVLCLNKKLVSFGTPEEAMNNEAIKNMYGESANPFLHNHK